MALIQRGMYEQYAARHLAVKGPGALTNIEDGVMGVLPLDSSSPNEYWFIQGINTFSFHTTKNANAGNYSCIGLHVQASRPLLCIPHTLTENTTNAFKIGRCTTSQFTGMDPQQVGVGIDTRIASARDSRTYVAKTHIAAYPGQIVYKANGSNDPIDLKQMFPCVVSPGEIIYVAGDVANTEVSCSWVWSEQDAYKAEL